jgi:hypothetical protein
MDSGFRSSTFAVLLSPHSISKVEPSTAYSVPLLAGQETEVLSVFTVVFAKGAKVDVVESVEEMTAVPGRAEMELVEMIVVKPMETTEAFNVTDALGSKKLGAVVRGTEMFEMLVDQELAAVVAGNAILEKFAKAEGSAVEGAKVELDIALDTAGGLGGAGI